MRISDQLCDLRESIHLLPIHTDSTLIVENSYCQGMPKNLDFFANKKMEDFINQNLSVIEEIAHRSPKNIIPRWFLKYQNKYYSKQDLLRGDGFFQTRLRDGYRNSLNPNFCEIREIGIFGNIRGYFNSVSTKVFGADLETSTTSDSTSTGWNGFLFANKLAVGTVGQYYDRVALKIFSAVGNYRLGVYDDSGSTVPQDLYAETGSIAVASGYTFQSLTEFALSTTQNWTAVQVDSASCNIHFSSAAGAGQRQEKAFAYGAFENPVTGLSAVPISPLISKIGHS